MTVSIYTLQESDKDQWLPLWDENNQGMGAEKVTETTWSRLINPDFPVFGLAAKNEDDELLGFLHYVLHPTTGHIQPVCYMQDLYVSEDHRKQGVAKTLVIQLAALGQRENWARLYWLSANENKAAAALYKNIGIKLDFSLHVFPLQA